MINSEVAVLLGAADQMCLMPQWFVNIHKCHILYIHIFGIYIYCLYIYINFTQQMQ